MGFTTNHSYVVVPSALWVVSRRRPFDTSSSASGTVSAIRWLSGSSACVSLLGHHTLAPSPWSVVTTHVRPRLSLVQVKPPSHGGRLAGRGWPWRSEERRVGKGWRAGGWVGGCE